GLRLGPYRLDVSRGHRGAHRRADDSAALRGDPAHPVQHHRARDRGDLRDRRLHGAQRAPRHHLHAVLRRRRVSLQQARLAARAAGARAGPRRHGGELVPAGDAAEPGEPFDLLVELARRLDQRSRDGDAVLAAHRPGARLAPGPAQRTRRCSRLKRLVYKIPEMRPEVSKLDIKPLDTGASFRTLAYAALKQAIMGADIYGQAEEIRLDERQLSQALGVSRTPVREAMTLLEQEGFLRTEPRRGVFIVRKTRKQIVEMIEVWAALESLAA